jgi:stearoyl-CoA desaturase (delta-9 desaturase)
LATFTAVILPFLGILVAGAWSWGWGFSGVELGLLLLMYFLTAVGITVGYHRLFTHRSFQAVPAVQFVLAVLGSMAIEGPMLKWVAMHRRHHQFSDEPDDPHSPHHHGSGVRGLVRGFWHAHLGWIFTPDPPHLDRYVKDLQQSRMLRTVSALFPLWVAVGLFLPAVLGGIITGTWMGALLGFVWGGLVRIFLVHHVTWCINSVCHLWGRRPFRCADESRDNFLFGVLGMGEGWHQSHHTFPSSARHGLRWGQIDVSYWVIVLLARLGLAWDIKTVTKEQQLKMRA